MSSLRSSLSLWEGTVRRSNGSRFGGVKFKRQLRFDRYVADFYCHAAKLVTELDGKQHDRFVDYDDAWTRVIENSGVRVIRFSDDEVCADVELVLGRIRQELRLPFV